MPTLDDIISNIAKTNELDVSSAKIGNKGLKKIALLLKTNETIAECYLDGNDIDDQGIKHLALAMENNHCVTLLALDENKITCEGAKYLGAMLKKNETLKVLDLRKNQISDEGIAELAQSLIQNTTLERLYLKDNFIESMGAIKLAEMIEQKDPPLKQVDLEANHIETEAVLRCKTASHKSGTEINYGYQSVGFRATGYKKEGTSEVVEDSASIEINGQKVFAAR